jgi:ATP-dependent Clp protease ATP-binding subunit ClpA
MGARPMARLIQETIKKPLADEVLFGKLKAGGHVRVIKTKDEESGLDKLGFEYLDGPVTPKPEKIPEAKPKRRSPRRKPPGGPRGDGGPPSPRGSVPKVPLVKV